MKSILVVCMLAATFAGSVFSQDPALAPLPPGGFVTLEQVANNCNKLQTGVLMKKLAEHGIPTE